MALRNSTASLKRLVELERDQGTDEYLKTADMFRLERKFKQPIRQLLAPGIRGKVLAVKYGVSESVISRWRKRLGIEIEPAGQFKPVVM